jgi:hypothetical protein
MVFSECIRCSLWYLLNALSHAPGEYLCEMRDQLRDVLRALPQGRDQNGEYVQPIVKISSEFIARSHRGQVAMGGGDQTHVDVMRAPAAQALELLFLQNAQKFRLQGQWQISNFIKESRAPVAPAGSTRTSASPKARNGVLASAPIGNSSTNSSPT